MLYSYRIEQAIRAATLLHQDQFRKGVAPYPYVAHPYAVALIISDYTDDEDTIIAGLLHDTLEDTDYTQEELAEDFGARVRDIVEGVTVYKDPEGKETWKDRRERYLKGLGKAPKESYIVSAADKIHNMRSVVEEYHGNPARLLTDFGGTLEERMVMDQKLSNILNRELHNDIIHEFNHVFAEYKAFIEHAQEEQK